MTAIAPHSRRFGVEIECGYPGSYASALKLLSVEQGFTRGWYGKADGSAIEVCTPVLSGPKGFAELKRAFKVLRDHGGYISIADGLHTHHDITDLNKEARVRLATLWLDNQEAIYEMVAPWRRGSSMCYPWTKADLARFKQGNGFYPYGYTDLRYRSETVEIRLHEGTLEYEVAETWIKFVQRLIHAAVQGDIIKITPEQREQALVRLGMSVSARKRIAAKIAAGHRGYGFTGRFTGKADGFPKRGDGIAGAYNEAH